MIFKCLKTLNINFNIKKYPRLLTVPLLILLQYCTFLSMIIIIKYCHGIQLIIFINEMVKTFRTKTNNVFQSWILKIKLIKYDTGGQCCSESNAEKQMMPGPLANRIIFFSKESRLVIDRQGLYRSSVVHRRNIEAYWHLLSSVLTIAPRIEFKSQPGWDS